MEVMKRREKRPTRVEREMEVMKGREKGPTRVGREVRVQAVKSEADDESEDGKVKR